MLDTHGIIKATRLTQARHIDAAHALLYHNAARFVGLCESSQPHSATGRAFCVSSEVTMKTIIKAEKRRRAAAQRARHKAREQAKKALAVSPVKESVRIVKPKVRIIGTYSIERDNDGCILALRDEKNITATREQIMSIIRGLQDFNRSISDGELERSRAWDVVRLEAEKAAAKPRANTGPGFVYVMKLDKYYKIGISHTPARRLIDLQCSFPLPIVLLRTVEVTNMRAAEKFLHDRFVGCWAAGEWFVLQPEDLLWIAEHEDDFNCL